MPRLDRTILSPIALTIAAGGAFTVLTKYNVPQLNYAFFGPVGAVDGAGIQEN